MQKFSARMIFVATKKPSLLTALWKKSLDR